jgi:hypothetical protein
MSHAPKIGGYQRNVSTLDHSSRAGATRKVRLGVASRSDGARLGVGIACLAPDGRKPASGPGWRRSPSSTAPAFISLLGRIPTREGLFRMIERQRLPRELFACMDHAHSRAIGAARSTGRRTVTSVEPRQSRSPPFLRQIRKPSRVQRLSAFSPQELRRAAIGTARLASRSRPP